MDCPAHPPCGSVRGRREGGVESYRAIPYAAPPTGALRFAPPQEPAAWSEVRDATVDGPVAPQGKSRLVAVTGGAFEPPQSEDCLALNVFTPSTAGAQRSVMVWIHGGGFVGGAGSLPWYDGDRLAARGDAVIVSVNFRQGALGHLYLPGVSPGNLALLDIVAALRWVRDNIEAFGGDPRRVTLFGQSSGGAAVAALMAMPAAEGLFQRAILQSAPLGRPQRGAEQAAELGLRFAACLGLDPADVEGFRRAPVAAILAAQAEFARSFKPQAVGASEQAFGPVVDGQVLLPRHQAWGSSPVDGIDLLLGTTGEEQAAAYHIDPAVRAATPQQVSQAFEHVGGAQAQRLQAHYRKMRQDVGAELLLCDLYTDVLFRLDTLRLAQRQAAAGHRAWVYQFDWQSPAGLRACHCLELPFVFGNPGAWQDALMLAGTPAEEFLSLSQAMQDAWLSFARAGNPNHAGLPAWPPYAAARATMRFDGHPEVVEDLADVSGHPLA